NRPHVPRPLPLNRFGEGEPCPKKTETGVTTPRPERASARGPLGRLAGPAYRLLGKKDLGTPGDYLTDKMPAVNTLVGGELAGRQHDGGHTTIPNFPAFFEWAGRYISSPGLRKKE